MRRIVAMGFAACALQSMPHAAIGQSVDLPAASANVIDSTNAFRRENHLHDLQIEPRLMRAADEFAEYMARSGKYGHEADGRDPAKRAQAHGYDYCLVLENIAYHYDSRGFRTSALARRVVEGWEDSPGHRKNMLNALVTHVGVGVARASNGYYYSVQMLGLPRSASVRFEVRNDSRRELGYRIGEEAHRIPARSIRTHEVCTREPVRFDGLPGAEGLTPRTGDRFVVPAKGDRVNLERR